jgi:transglutaminase-like putative cysteine protease
VSVELIADAPSAYLGRSDAIDVDHPVVRARHARVVAGAEGLEDQARRIFAFVRDEVRHSLDAGEPAITLRASDVLIRRTGLCYAKSHLAAAMLRLSGIPTGLCYQLVRDEHRLVLHGLVAVHLRGGWHRLDVRGNKLGVDACFDLEEERLAFRLDPAAGECDLPDLLAEPAPSVVRCLASGGDLRHLRLPDGLD